MSAVHEPRPVVRFSSRDDARRWTTTDDVVMGGRSSSRFEPTAQGHCAFAGRVSLEDGGGFASVRSQELSEGLQGTNSLLLTCRGDGKTYRLRLCPREGPEGLAYQAPFTTLEGEWMQHEFRPEDFTPSRRGRVPSDAPPLELARVNRVGFLISDRQAGPFRLELRSLEKTGPPGAS